MNISKLTSPILMLALGACSASTQPTIDGEEGAYDTGGAITDDTVAQRTDMVPMQDRVQVTLQATDAAGDSVALFGCETFRVAAGTANAQLSHAPAIRADPTGEGPSCTMTASSNMHLAIVEDSESYVSLHGTSMGGYATQITTGEADASSASLRYHLLSQAQLSAVQAFADVEPNTSTSVVVVETPTDGMAIELLLGGRGQGPAPIYLGADGEAGEHDHTAADGWVVFLDVPSGMHTLSFGHPSLDCAQAPGFGWAGDEAGLSKVMAIPGSTNIVAGITCD